MKIILTFICTLFLFQLTAQQETSYLIKMNNGDSLNAIKYQLSDKLIKYSTYFTKPDGSVSETVTWRTKSISDVNYIAGEEDTTYFNFVVNGQIFNKQEMLDKVMMEEDLPTYNMRLGYTQLKKSGAKLIVGTLVGIGGSILATSFAANGNATASMGTGLATGLISLTFNISGFKSLIKSGKYLLDSRSDKNYYYQGVLLND